MNSTTQTICEKPMCGRPATHLSGVGNSLKLQLCAHHTNEREALVSKIWYRSIEPFAGPFPAKDYTATITE